MALSSVSPKAEFGPCFSRLCLRKRGGGSVPFRLDGTILKTYSFHLLISVLLTDSIGQEHRNDA